MTRKTEEEFVDLYDLKEKNTKKKKLASKKVNHTNKTKKKANKSKSKIEEGSTKDEKFNFDEEIIIGLRRIDNEKVETEKNRKTKNAKNKKSSKKNLDKPQKIKDKKVSQKIQKQQAAKVERELTKEQRIAKQKRKIIFRLVKWTTLLCIVIGGCIYTLLSPIFNVKNIEVGGNTKLSNEEVISLSKIELEQNMFSYKTREIINNVKENAYVDSVIVKRKLPDTVELIISERKASFMIAFANAYALINNQGYILEIVSKPDSLPMIEGIETEQEQIQAGNRLCTEDLKKLSDVLQIMESATSNGINTWITNINITDSDDYVLTLQKQKKVVHLGDTTNLSTKMLWIIEFNEKEKNTQGEIILNMNIDKPIFRRNV